MRPLAPHEAARPTGTNGHQRPHRVALYVRVSSEEQLEGYSLDAQVRAARGFCADRGWEIVAHNYVQTELLAGERTVEELAAAAELSVSATSHHLRLLRSLRLVRARRDGRHVRYRLHDDHIAELLAAVRHHHEHVHPPAPVELPPALDAQRA